MIAALLMTLASSAQQDPEIETDYLKKYGLKANAEFVAIDGKVSFAKGEVIELVGAADLSETTAQPWGFDGKIISNKNTADFWKIMDFRDPEKVGDFDIRDAIRDDPDKRTFALAFKISDKKIAFQDVAEDEGKNYELYLTKTVPHTTLKPFIGLARVMLPKSESNFFDYRIESPGGEWKDLIKFGYQLETKKDDMEFVMRQYPESEFVEVDGEQTTYEFVSYFLTLKIPESLHELDLRVISNDTAEQLNDLPIDEPSQHIPGESKSEWYKGYDLFILYAPKKKEFDRVFTLQARPKRIGVFKNIPIKPIS